MLHQGIHGDVSRPTPLQARLQRGSEAFSTLSTEPPKGRTGVLLLRKQKRTSYIKFRGQKSYDTCSLKCLLGSAPDGRHAEALSRYNQVSPDSAAERAVARKAVVLLCQLRKRLQKRWTQFPAHDSGFIVPQKSSPLCLWGRCTGLEPVIDE